MSPSPAIRLALVCVSLCASACATSVTAPTATNGAASPIVGTIPLDAFATDVVVSPDGARGWAATSAHVVVLDLQNRRVAGAIATGDMPYALALPRSGQPGLGVDLMEREGWVLDLAAGSVIRTLTIGEPRTPALRPGIAVTQDGARAFVSVSQVGDNSDSLRVFDVATGRLVTRRGLDFHPGAIALSPDDRFLYVVGCHGFCSDGTVHVFSTAGLSPIAQMEIASVPGGIAVARDGSRAWVANGLAAQVSVIDLQSNSVAASVPVGAGALDLAVSPDGSRVYITDFDANSLSVIDTTSNTELARVPIGKAPRAIALSPDGRTAYVTHSEPVVSVIDLTRLTH